MRFSELENNNKEAKKLSLKRLLEGWKNIKEMIYYQDLLYILKVICSELISRHHNNLFIGYFGIKKMQKLIVRKYYWPILQKNIEIYIKSCNIYLASKAICYKPYGDL